MFILNEMNKVQIKYKLLKISIFFIFITVLISCSYNKQLEENFKHQSFIDSPGLRDDELYHKIYELRGQKKIYVNLNHVILNDNSLLEKTIIQKNKLPFYYLGYQVFNCNIGREFISYDLFEYIPGSFYIQAEQSGVFHTKRYKCFGGSKERNLKNFKTIYDLEIIIDSLRVEGTFLFAGEQHHTAYPARAVCDMTINLKKDGDIILNKTIKHLDFTQKETKTKITNVRRLNSSELQANYAKSMYYVLMNTIYYSIDNAVESINEYIMLVDIDDEDIEIEKLYE